MLNDDNGQRSYSLVDSTVQCFSEMLLTWWLKVVGLVSHADTRREWLINLFGEFLLSTLVICCQAVPQMCQQSKWQAQGYVCNEPPMAMCPPDTLKQFVLVIEEL